jgi:multidrug efflux pump subunit AcrA (membrane-fusion protein)
MRLTLLVTLAALPWIHPSAAEPGRATNLIILDATGAANLQLDFAEATETTFEETIFALGELEVLPGKRAVVSSRIPGRAHSVLVIPHQQVQQGDEVAWVESRQPGDPPPTVRLDAPISGLVSKVNIAQGQPISTEDTLIEIVDLSTLEASAHVPLHLAGKLALGQTAHMRVPSLPNQVFEAKLAHLATKADSATGTLEAAFHVLNTDLSKLALS